MYGGGVGRYDLSVFEHLPSMSPRCVILNPAALTSLDIRYSVIELCRPVGGLFPKLQSACKLGSGGNGTVGAGTASSGLAPKPTATGGSVTPPFTGGASRVMFGVDVVGFVGMMGLVILMM